MEVYTENTILKIKVLTLISIYIPLFKTILTPTVISIVRRGIAIRFAISNLGFSSLVLGFLISSLSVGKDFLILGAFLYTGKPSNTEYSSSTACKEVL